MPGHCRCRTRLDGKTVVVTGANTGIGKETAADLAKRGGRVILACRNVAKAEEAATEIREQEGVSADNVVVMKLDLADFSSIKSFVEEFNAKEQHLHILINNAGIFMHDRSKTKDGLEMHMGVNHFGHFLLTRLLLPILESSAPSRIINVSSSLHRTAAMHFDDLQHERRSYGVGLQAYSESKLANILFTNKLAEILKEKRVTVNALHPGRVRTEALRHTRLFPGRGVLSALFNPVHHMLYMSSKQGAQTTIHLAVSPDLDQITGQYFDNCSKSDPSREARSESDADRLWQVSEEICGAFLKT